MHTIHHMKKFIKWNTWHYMAKQHPDLSLYKIIFVRQGKEIIFCFTQVNQSQNNLQANYNN